MFFKKLTSSRTFHLIPAQDTKKRAPSRTFRLIPAQDNKSELIKRLQEILPENSLYTANFNGEKENFGVDIIESKDEFIADIASTPMLDVSVESLIIFIEENRDNYLELDFIKLLKEQIEVQVSMHYVVSSITGLKYPKSMDESICAKVLKKYIESKSRENISREEFQELKNIIGIYNGFITSYQELLKSGAYLGEELREDVYEIFQRFTDSPDDIDTLTLMRIEKVLSASKHTTSYFK